MPRNTDQENNPSANRSKFLTKQLKRGLVHNLDLLEKELLNKNPAKKTQTHKKSNFGKHPMLRLYKKHDLASKLFLFIKEIYVELSLNLCLGNLMLR